MIPENYELLKREIPDIAEQVKLFPEHLQEKVFNLLTGNLLNQPPILTSSEEQVSLSEEIGVPATPDNSKRNYVEEFKEFLNKKDPQSKLNGMEFSAVVAYFFAYEAPPEDKREYIDTDLLLEACRLVKKNPPGNPRATLNNAKNKPGYLKAGPKSGLYAISPAGEYFVNKELPK